LSSPRAIAGRVTRVAVTHETISVADLVAAVRSRRSGAVMTFVGTVRDHHAGRRVSHLRYEAYVPMAERVIETIAAEAVSRWEVERVAVQHRVGRLEIGEISVVIALSAPHRAPAFEALRFIIETLKRQAPIWKHETGPEGSCWIEGPEQVEGPDAP